MSRAPEQLCLRAAGLAQPAVASTAHDGKHSPQWQSQPAVAITAQGGQHSPRWQAQPVVASTAPQRLLHNLDGLCRC